jgi:hypothetical protein
MSCSTEELEALVAGERSPEEAARLRAHVEGCTACRDELAWLTAEAELMARRRDRQELSSTMWQEIADRLARPATPGPSPAQHPTPVRVRRWGLGARVAYGGLLAAAAAAVVFATWPGQQHVLPRDLRDAASTAPMVAEHHKLPASVALDRAEREYLDAARVLEAEYRQERGRLPASVAERYDRTLAETRTHIADARATAGNDVDGRMVVLDGYAEYLRSLQTIVTDIR